MVAQSILPVTAIDIRALGENSPIPKKNLAFFYHVTCRTIESCLNKTYSDFDAHTTSNCCHGISLLVRNLISSLNHLNLKQLQQEAYKKIESLNHNSLNEKNNLCPCTWWVPESILNLARLYILAFAKKTDPQKGILTYKARLKLISQVGTNFCDHLINSLQQHFSNLIAFQYMHYLKELPKDMQMHGISLKTWGKYVQPDYLRLDKRGIYYTSAMFSMQVSLAYLISSRAKIAIISDLIETTNQVKTRLIYLCEGDSYGQMRSLTPIEIKNLPSNSKEPVVVFGGCTYLQTFDEKKIQYCMQSWENQFPSLILACDVWYPQFPNVASDPTFDNTPIIPHETGLKDLIAKHSKISGVSATDPSLFCLTHIYTASLYQVLCVLNGYNKTILPISFIPQALWGSMRQAP